MRVPPFAAVTAAAPMLAVAAVLAGCAAPPPPQPGAADPGDRPSVPVVDAIPAGTLLRLLPVAGLDGDPAGARAVDAWWREALRQSVAFDVAAYAEGTRDGAVRVQLSLDQEARALAATLLREDAPPMAIAGAEFRSGDLQRAIDRLAWSARIALGEDAAPPLPCGPCTSADPIVAAGVEDGLAALVDGRIDVAVRTLEGARRRDGGSPWLLDALAAAKSLRGDAAAAERLALEALGYTQRLAPSTQHRLARTLLLARASLRPENAQIHDRELLALGLAGRRERPHDPQCAFTEALARNFLGEFAASRALLRDLAERMPANATVRYHLGWAELALGEPHAAARALDAAARTLPPEATFVPRAIARYESGDHEGVRELIAEMLKVPAIANGPALHQLRRVEAAHALLMDLPEDAAKALLADLAWLQQKPSLLDRSAGDLAGEGEVLVRLGHAADLPPLLAAIRAQMPPAAVADACAFVSGLADIASGRGRARVVEEALDRGGKSAWSAVLAAFSHRTDGAVGDEQQALAEAARLTADPLVKASLVRSLRATGRNAEADALRAALRRELRAIHLRRSLQHPLLGPELALAFKVD